MAKAEPPSGRFASSRHLSSRTRTTKRCPFRERIASEWIADEEVVEYLGNMTALPQEFLDRGIGQECWAFWIEADRRWDW